MTGPDSGPILRRSVLSWWREYGVVGLRLWWWMRWGVIRWWFGLHILRWKIPPGPRFP